MQTKSVSDSLDRPVTTTQCNLEDSVTARPMAALNAAMTVENKGAY